MIISLLNTANYNFYPQIYILLYSFVLYLINKEKISRLIFDQLLKILNNTKRSLVEAGITETFFEVKWRGYEDL